jgi:hypothetical protein
MWKLSMATLREWHNELVKDERMLEAENIMALVRRAQALIADGNGVYVFVPHPDNPPFSLYQYAELLGADIHEAPDQTIHGHFVTWVRHGRVIVRPLYHYKRNLRYRT